MTAQVVAMNKGAVALAADSKATMRIGGTLKSHEAANKLFSLSKVHPVGIMINGNAEFMELPWETIIEVYRERLKNRCCAVLEDYAKDFMLSLTSDYTFTEMEQQRNAIDIAIDKLQDLESKVRDRVGDGDTRKPATIVLDLPREALAALDNQPTLTVMEGISLATVKQPILIPYWRRRRITSSGFRRS